MAPGDPTLNPAGRPKKLPELDDLLSELLGVDEDGAADSAGAMEILAALKKQAKRGNVRAAEILLERAYGKVPNKNEHTGKDGADLPAAILTVRIPSEPPAD